MDKVSQQILEFLQTIPKGKVATYKSIADRFDVHPRKVAMVMKYNKQPDIYPCYKVISTSGKLWWYSAYDWVNSKIKMLEADGVIIKDWRIDPSWII